jgi:hypothetical protein
MWGRWLYMETQDDYVVSLNAVTGKERVDGTQRGLKPYFE